MGSGLAGAAVLRVGDGARQRAIHAEIVEHHGGFAHFGGAAHAMFVDALRHVAREIGEVGAGKAGIEARNSGRRRPRQGSRRIT